MEPIAIIGIACSFANGIESPHDLWHVLTEQIDLNSEIPLERLDLQSFTADLIKINPTLKEKLIQRGYFMKNDQLDKFDPQYFGLTDNDALLLDPAHRLLLKKFVHLIEDAGLTIDEIRGTKTSVHIGQYSTDHQQTMMKQSLEERKRLLQPSMILFNASARLAYHFDLHGPNLALDSACSSSLQALHLACQTLRNNESNFAIAGGVNTIYSPDMFLDASTTETVATDGRSKSFSQDANGYGKGEGCGLVLLKRLKDAERDGNSIYCVIRDVLSNHDGQQEKTGYAAPSPLGQYSLLEEIYSRNQSRIDPKQIFYVEAHGTGTQVGDSVETNTIGKFFNRSHYDCPLLIGSIKSNIGHTEGASGIAGLIKVALCMKYRMIPAQMNFKQLNPKIKAKKYNLHIIQHTIQFPEIKETTNEPILIGINSFGIGGNNTHCIVQEYKQPVIIEAQKTNESIERVWNDNEQYFILIFSSKCQQSLRNQIEKFNSWLSSILLTNQFDQQQKKLFLTQLSHKLLIHRTLTYSHRLSFLVKDLEQFQNYLTSFLTTESNNKLPSGIDLTIDIKQRNAKRKLCFIYAGQGPQWFAMGRQLYKSEPIYRQWIEKIDYALKQINNEWSLLDELIDKDEEQSRISDTNIAQPCLFALQIALTALWLSWGIYPQIIIGHSAGEVAAAYINGRLSFKEAIEIIYHRSRLQHRNTRQNGRILAVGMNEKEIEELIKDVKDHVCIAAINSPKSITLSGDSNILEELYEILNILKPKIFKTWIKVENAFHSQQMERFNIKQDLLDSLKTIKGTMNEEKFDIKCSQAKLYSTVTGQLTSSDSNDENYIEFNNYYWWSNVRQAVQFNKVIELLTNEDIEFLEISPHPVLTTSIQQCFDSHNRAVKLYYSLKRKEDEQETILTNLSHLNFNNKNFKEFLTTRSYPIFQKFFSFFDTLPLFTFNHNDFYWYESKESVLQRRATRQQYHPLLGVRLWSLEQQLPTWKSIINLQLPEYSYLKDHQVQEQIYFPATGYIELILAAINELYNYSKESELSTITLNNVEFLEACILNETQPREIHTVIQMPFKQFFIYSRRCRTSTDCVRENGLSGNDILDDNDYRNENKLHNYLSKQWSLHSTGFIQIENLNSKTITSSLYNFDDIQHNIIQNQICSLNEQQDIENLYKTLSNRGNTYGPLFQQIKSFVSTRSKVLTEINTHVNDKSHYYIHPIILDTCLQSGLTLLQDNYAYVPIGVDKITIYPQKNLNMLYAYTDFHSPTIGITKNYKYSADILLFDEEKKNLIVLFENLKMQQLINLHSYKFQENDLILPSYDNNQMKYLFNNYCLQMNWIESKIVLNFNELLPKPKILFDTETLRHRIETGQSERDHCSINGIDHLNKFALNYVLLMFKQLLNNQGKLNEINLKQFDNFPWMNETNDKNQHFILLIQSFLKYFQTYNITDENGQLLIDTTSLTNHSMNLDYIQLIKKYPSIQSVIDLIRLSGENLLKILSEDLDPLELYFGGNGENELLMQDLYLIISQTMIELICSSLTNYLEKQILSRKYPSFNYQLTILEVGAGTGASTIPILEILLEFANKTQTQIHYIFTDISPSFFTKAKNYFQSLLNENNQHGLLTISYDIYDLDEQENHLFDENKFDIIFASNVIHATSYIEQSIINLKQLLKLNGLLILVESTGNYPLNDLIYGPLSQWWSLNETNSNTIREKGTHSLLSVDQWFELFNKVGGFEEIDSSTTNSFEESLIVAQKTIDDYTEQQGWIIFSDQINQIGLHLGNLLQTNNIIYIKQNENNLFHNIFQTSIKRFKQINILYLWPLDLQNNDFQQQEFLCTTLMTIIKIIKQQNSNILPYLFVFTKNAQNISLGQTIDPIQSPIIGFGRTALKEYKTNYLKLIDLNSSSSLSEHFLITIINEINLVLFNIPSKQIDQEIILLETSDIKRYIPSYDDIEKEDIQQTYQTVISPNSTEKKNFYLKLSNTRFISDLKWILKKDCEIYLDTDEVEIEIHSVGINFRDVLKAKGLYPATSEFGLKYNQQDGNVRDEELGSDFSGKILRIGSNIKEFQINDIVIGCTCQNSAFQSNLIINQTNIVRVHENLMNIFTMEELASIPTPYSTVFYAFKYRVHLQKNQTVLIHTASGGVGLAAIQYCLMLGISKENLICTAGTIEKREYLREKFDLIHIFNSRDLSFVENIRKIFPQGVNVILNSLSGKFLQESIKLLSTHGHFIEIGKRDIYSEKTYDLLLYQLRFGCSFHIIDLVTCLSTEPKLLKEILNEILQLFENNLLKPIEQVHIYEPSEIIDVFHLYEQAKHIGKQIVRITGAKQLLTVEEDELPNNCQLFPSSVCNQGTILISGGTGGLGIEMSKWMIMERKVKRILLMARQNQEEFEQSNSYQLKDWLNLKHLIETKYKNVIVEIRKCDVTQYDQVYKLIKELNQTNYPIRGIIHAALVLEDSLIHNMTNEQLIKVMRPKILGAWNLHQTTTITQTPLHFFLLFSSLRNHLCAQLGASAYNAGNQYLESLAYYRYNYLKQPALAISLPGITQVGFFHRQRKISAISEHLLKTDANMFFLPPIITFELIENLFQNQQQKSYSTSIIFALNWSSLHSKLDHLQSNVLEDLVKRKYFQLEYTNTNQQLETTVNSMNIETIIEKIRSAVAQIFGSSNIDRIDIEKSLNQQGMDSLMAVSLRNWLEKELFISIPLSDIFQGITIQYLSQSVLSKLNERSNSLKQVNSNKIATSEINHEKIHMLDNEDDQYTNLSLLHCLYQEKLTNNNSKPILFCFIQNSIQDLSVETEQFIEKITNHFSSIYLMKYSENDLSLQSIKPLVDEHIQQIRRLQPRGPYFFISDINGYSIIYKLIKQFKNNKYHHSNTHSLILIKKDFANGQFNDYIDKLAKSSYDIDKEHTILFEEEIKVLNNHSQDDIYNHYLSVIN